MIITISEKSGIERGYKLIIYGPSRVDWGILKATNSILFIIIFPSSHQREFTFSIIFTFLHLNYFLLEKQKQVWCSKMDRLNKITDDLERQQFDNRMEG
jgi:hypothetical protein